MAYEIETEDGTVFEFTDNTPESEALQVVDTYQAKPAQNAVDVHKTFGEQVGDMVLEGAAAMNRGALGIFDIPPVLFNAVSELAGSDVRAELVSQLPVIESGTVGEFMEEGAAKDAVRTGGEFFGGSIFGSFGFFARAAQARKGQQAVGELNRQALPVGAITGRTATGGVSRAPGAVQSAVRDPSAAFAREATSGALFAAGGAAGSALSEDDPLVSLAGGLIAATRGAPVRLAKDVTVGMGSAMKQIFSTQASKKRAFEFVTRYADNPQDALRTLRNNLAKGKTGTLAQMTEDKGIAAVERRLINNAPTDIGAKIAVSDDRLVDGILKAYDEAAGVGTTGVASDFMKARVNGSLARVNAVVQKAQQKATHIAETVGTPLEPKDASAAFSGVLDDAFTAIRGMEDEAWSKVLSKIRQPTIGIKADMRRHFQSMTPTARKAVMPTVRREFQLVKGLEKQVHPRELADLRGEILAAQRAARDGNASSNTIKALDEMQKAVLRAIDGADTSSAYRAASAITKRKHELFFDGLVGQARTARNVTPESLGEKLMRAGGVGGPLADEIKTISDDFAAGALQSSTDEMVRAAFGKAVVNADGTVNPAAAERFLKRYDGLLSRFPQLKQELSSAEGAQRAADRLVRAGKNATRAIEKSRAALYSQFQSPKRAVESIFSGSVKNPAQAIRSLVQTAQRDTTGAAYQGLKRDFIDTIQDRMVVTTAKGTNINRGFEREWSKFRPVLRDSNLFSKQEFQRLDDIVDDMRRYYIREGVPAIKENIQEDVIAIALGQIAGARIGARFGTTPLIAAGLGRKFAQKVLQRMPRDKAMGFIEDMIMNPQNFDDFASQIQRAETQQQALSAFNSWMTAAGLETIKEEEIPHLLAEEAELTAEAFLE